MGGREKGATDQIKIRITYSSSTYQYDVTVLVMNDGSPMQTASLMLITSLMFLNIDGIFLNTKIMHSTRGNSIFYLIMMDTSKLLGWKLAPLISTNHDLKINPRQNSKQNLTEDSINKDKNMIYLIQHGFTENMSCQTKLISFLDEIASVIDNGNDVGETGLCKGFDLLWHSTLIKKLAV